MRDPIKDLENFNQPGTTVNHLTASEVRRRGDRMRRRNNILAGVGGVAAVVLIATPFAVFAGGDTDSAPDPAPAPTSPTQGVETTWLQQIPSTFDLTENLAGEDAGLTQSETPTIDDITMCGVSSWLGAAGVTTPIVDVLGTENSGGESLNARTLALFTGPDAAQSALETIRAGVLACPNDPNASPVPRVYDLVGADLGTDDSLVFTEQAKVDGALSDLFVTQVARTGNALYLAKTYSTEGGQAAVESTVALLATSSAPVIGNLCIFSAEPCTNTPPSSDPSEASGSGVPSNTAIPADFPIDTGLVAATADGGEMFGPGPRAKGVAELNLCGTVVWPVEGDDRLAATATGPEYSASRELITFGSADEAVAALVTIRDAVDACPEMAGDTRENDMFFAVLPVDASYDSATFGMTYRVGLGGGIWQFVRVGRSLLGTSVGGEYAPETIEAGADALNEGNKEVTSAMCIFTDEGC